MDGMPPAGRLATAEEAGRGAEVVDPAWDGAVDVVEAVVADPPLHDATTIPVTSNTARPKTTATRRRRPMRRARSAR